MVTVLMKLKVAVLCVNGTRTDKMDGVHAKAYVIT